VKSKQHRDSLFIDLLFKRVDLVVFRNNLVAEFAAAAQKSLEGVWIIRSVRLDIIKMSFFKP
jgi:hypothetical protein